MDQALKHTRRADYIGIWWTLIGPGGILVTVFSTIIGFFEPIAKYGWAAVVLAAVAAACLVILVASLGMIGWRALNPLPKVTSGKDMLASQPSMQDRGDGDITALIDHRMNEFLATTLRAEFATHAHMHSRDERLAEISDEARSAKGSAALAFDFAEKKYGEAASRIDDLAKGCSNLEQRFNDWTRSHCEDQDQRFKNVDGGFRAIRDRETLEKLANKIRVQADGLLRTSRGDRVENWGVWNSQNLQWQQDITAYCRMASHYLTDVPGLIEHVPSHRLQGGWPEERDLFPSDDAVIAYRTAAVKMQNFEQQHDRVMACVTSFAFESPSMKGISNR